ncbi:hypothetical protein MRX96_013282 [Rhipicephalus microplus]
MVVRRSRYDPQSVEYSYERPYDEDISPGLGYAADAGRFARTLITPRLPSSGSPCDSRTCAPISPAPKARVAHVDKRKCLEAIAVWAVFSGDLVD